MSARFDGLHQHAEVMAAFRATALLARIATAARTTLREAAAERAARIAEYRRDLEAMDWGFQFSDDARAVRAGYRALSYLQQAQADLDPDFCIWNLVAPAAHRRPA